MCASQIRRVRGSSAVRDERGGPSTCGSFQIFFSDASEFQRIKSNKTACEQLAERAAQIVQDIWRQTKDFDVMLPAEVEGSVVEIETYVPPSSMHTLEYRPRLAGYSEKSKTFSMGSKKSGFGNNSFAKTAIRAKSRSMGDYWTRRCRSSVYVSLSMSTDQVRALNPGTKINLQFSIHRLHVEAAAAARKEHAAVLSAAQMSEAERLVRPMCLVIYR
jgi:hypothetical protein